MIAGAVHRRPRRMRLRVAKKTAELIYTATADTTKLSCLCRVRFGGVNWMGSRQLKTVADRKSEV